MNHNGSPTRNEPLESRGFFSLAHDVVELSELQAQLLVMDVDASTRRVRATLAIALVGLAVLLGSIPVVLLFLAEVLVEQAGWSRSVALGTSAGVGLAVTALLLGIVWRKIRHGLSTFSRSREELSQNMAWLKTTLRSNAERPNPWPSTAARSN